MVERVPLRLRWAVDVLDPQPADRLLEIGCGNGVAAALVCARLHGGHLLAIDRSAVAVERAARRNAAHLAAGRLEIRQCALAAVDVPPGSLDAAFCVNVNLFWTRAAPAELDRLCSALAPGGALHILYDAAPTSGERVISAVVAALRDRHFDDVRVRDGGGHGMGVSARAGDSTFIGRIAADPTIRE
ncbi:SAM-dependent methyltransferase [Pseudonocardia asaccharolytica]|uniref:Methyltransferase domain-containing protein n=1 Tax=Pseudonocardia asaccharolytica DSM 44247 = NBRC 16224 TaxID=1123024 RepID=A0A511D812_9PSEU|nr:class I SAM-dependent methyltransferase [Pseudonocardia asaccharolytica]GEL20916.1 hypothetical protein PA7_47530 [Pseudonocardia asaccharolytica DSM 44247 = NBRC 16224]